MNNPAKTIHDVLVSNGIKIETPSRFLESVSHLRDVIYPTPTPPEGVHIWVDSNDVNELASRLVSIKPTWIAFGRDEGTEYQHCHAGPNGLYVHEDVTVIQYNYHFVEIISDGDYSLIEGCRPLIRM